MTKKTKRTERHVLTIGALAVFGACGPPTPVGEPEPLGEIPIEYPISLWDEGVEGETILRVLVGDTGDVDSVEIATSSGHTEFDLAAVDGAKALRFSPARAEDGTRIAVWTEVPVRFSKRPRPDSLGPISRGGP